MSVRRSRPMGGFEVTVDLGDVQLAGTMIAQARAHGLVILPYLGPPGRRGRQSHRLVCALHDHGLATFAVELQTHDEVQRPGPRDVDALARRLVDAVDWIRSRPPVWKLAIGMIAADAYPVAVVAAAARPETVRFVIPIGDELTGLDQVAARAAERFGGLAHGSRPEKHQEPP